ncbi:AraC family transcriptional regulator [Sinorhizobium numidicum]|uniref:AraC family transcriptional regulator n=1 Tax=Sinorhizobium numidicum TaxID=680248 RepID=A0ABY8CT61_9HYPH|nr:AraC family transcriptional regulator [Sinorhizobium numidicum]WEX73918.1 AraC family transcriptional regulator [Sinorhizobium numidicum]WEX79903.1 AraC family transcriptional regulator [Sinorhizobium numidicum]
MHIRRDQLFVERLNVPPGGGTFTLSRLAVGIFLVDQQGHRLSLGSDHRLAIPLRASEGWVLPAGSEGVCEYDDPLSYVKLEVSDALLQDVGFDTPSDFRPVVGALDPLLVQLVRSAASNADTRRTLYRQTMDLAVAAHLAQLLLPVRTWAVAIEDRRLWRVLDYIHEHLADDLSLDEMASEATMSRFHFMRSFTKLVGKTPLQYVIQERMELAKVLLKTTRASIASVAHNVGYEDVSRFGKHFRRHTGVTPAVFRRG